MTKSLDQYPGHAGERVPDAKAVLQGKLAPLRVAGRVGVLPVTAVVQQNAREHQAVSARRLLLAAWRRQLGGHMGTRLPLSRQRQPDFPVAVVIGVASDHQWLGQVYPHALQGLQVRRRLQGELQSSRSRQHLVPRQHRHPRRAHLGHAGILRDRALHPHPVTHPHIDRPPVIKDKQALVEARLR